MNLSFHPLTRRSFVKCLSFSLLFPFSIVKRSKEDGKMSTYSNARHIKVFYEAGRYAGWPANYGIWSWGNEIVVGFTVGYFKNVTGLHKRDRDRRFIPMQARSLDGGESWEVQVTPCKLPGDKGLSVDEHVKDELRVQKELDDSVLDPPGNIDFTHPDFALMCARSGLRAGAKSWFYYSYDRCKTWEGPFKLPMFGQLGIAARTDYIVLSNHECLLFLTATKSNGEEGRPFLAKTTDGGRTFEFVSWICPEPEGFAIMPSSVKPKDGSIIVALRCHYNDRSWIELYSSDDGKTFNYLSTPVENTGKAGNPPSMIMLQDGRICLTYGYRAEPYGIRAKISNDDGRTWGEEIILRADGGDADIGYPRTVQRPDGTIVTVYYYNDHTDRERYIAATLWKI